MKALKTTHQKQYFELIEKITTALIIAISALFIFYFMLILF